MSFAKTMVLTLVAASLWATTTSADDTDTINDIRCVLVSLKMTEMDDAAIQTAGSVSMMYWMGRLDGRTPDLNLEERVGSEMEAMKPEAYREAATRCGDELTVRGKFIAAMGEDMKQKGIDMHQLENSR